MGAVIDELAITKEIPINKIELAKEFADFAKYKQIKTIDVEVIDNASDSGESGQQVEVQGKIGFQQLGHSDSSPSEEREVT